MNNYKNAKQQTKRTKRGNGRNSSLKDQDNMVNSRKNDANWYGNSSQLLRDAASLAYSNPVGAPLNIDGLDDSVPGLMRIRIHPTIGISTNNYSAVNVAARNIYSYVRHANSGHSNYDSPDLMMYLLAMDSAYSLYSFMVRAYGCMSLYTHYNRYYPRAIIEGMNLDPDDFMKNLPNFRYYLNQFVHKIGSFAVPASMPYFRRHMWMYEGLYVDDNSAKAQTYFFVPDGFYKYNELDGAGKLEFKTLWGTATLTFNGLMEYAEDLISMVYQSEDMNIMSGDILKAFGTDGIFKVAEVAPDYIVLPTYSEEVLSQIQNTLVFPVLGNDDITQDVTTGAILFNPYRQDVQDSDGDARITHELMKPYGYKRIINMYKDNVTPEDTMVATRLTAIGNVSYDVSSKTVTTYLDTCGSEYATEMAYAKFGVDGNDWVPSWYGSHFVLGLKAYSNGAITYAWNSLKIKMEKIVNFSKFRFHPALYPVDIQYNDAGTITDIAQAGHIMDLNNFTVVDSNDLKKMHETALLSEFSCPMMGAFNKKTTN